MAGMAGIGKKASCGVIYLCAQQDRAVCQKRRACGDPRLVRAPSQREGSRDRIVKLRAQLFAEIRAIPACSTHQDRKSTRLNSSHRCISYAVFCLKKKKTRQTI